MKKPGESGDPLGTIVCKTKRRLLLESRVRQMSTSAVRQTGLQVGACGHTPPTGTLRPA